MAKSELFQDTVKIIGEVHKLDGLRASRLGLESIFLLIKVPNPQAKRPVFIPCKIYGNKAVELEKLMHSGKIKVGGMVEAHGTHANNYNSNNNISLEVKLSSIEKFKANLFEE